MKRLTAWILTLLLLLGSFGLPAALAEASSVDQAKRGATTVKQLVAVLGREELFTADQVNCMSMEMLMACLTVCDAENGLELLEHYDPEAIAELLNERFFDTVKGVGLRYRITDMYDGGFTEEIGQQTLSWFESQKDYFVFQYGEENYRRVHEETAGYEEYLFPEYTVYFADGRTKQDGCTRGNLDGLTIIKSNGRYYWMAMDLFAGMEEPEEPGSPLQGKVKDGWYSPAGLGIRFRLEGWNTADRETLSETMYGDASLAAVTPEELLDQGLPYGDLMIQKDYTTTYFLLLKLPVKSGDGTEEKDLAAYMDGSEQSLQETFSGGGMSLLSMERSPIELGGRAFEMIRLHANGGIDQYYTLLATEEDGRLLVVNINGLGKDDTDELLSRFEQITWPQGELTTTEEGKRYVNQTLGFGIDLDDEWFMISQETPEQSAESRLSFLDLTAQRRDGTAGVNIGVDDIGIAGSPAETAEEYRDKSIPGLWDLVEEVGLKNARIEPCQVSFVGQEYPGISFCCSTPVQEWYCYQIIIPSGCYIVTLTLSTYDDDWRDELVGMFYPLD